MLKSIVHSIIKGMTRVITIMEVMDSSNMDSTMAINMISTITIIHKWLVPSSHILDLDSNSNLRKENDPLLYIISDNN